MIILNAHIRFSWITKHVFVSLVKGSKQIVNLMSKRSHFLAGTTVLVL